MILLAAILLTLAAKRRVPGQTPIAECQAKRRSPGQTPTAGPNADRRSPTAGPNADRRSPTAGPNAGISGERRVMSPYGLHTKLSFLTYPFSTKKRSDILIPDSFACLWFFTILIVQYRSETLDCAILPQLDLTLPLLGQRQSEPSNIVFRDGHVVQMDQSDCSAAPSV